MKEADLYIYRDAYNRYTEAEEELQAFKPALISPKAPVISFLPFSESTGESNLPEKIDRLIRLEAKRDKAKEVLEKAVDMLHYIIEHLDRPREREYLIDRYVRGLATTTISAKRGRARASLYRDRNSILEQIAKITYIV
jgi:hypothetical protein